MAIWRSSPEEAWKRYILPNASTDSRWINKSKSISDTIGLSMRELFGLVILAHLYNRKSSGWKTGYDQSRSQPNDGYITNDEQTIKIEHKVIVEEAKQEVLEEILAIYKKFAAKGLSYGKDRVLIIQPNKPPVHGGLIKISELAKAIGDCCNFDRVLTLSMVSKKGEGNRKGVFHLVQHYPPIKSGIAEVVFDFPTGAGEVTHCQIDL